MSSYAVDQVVFTSKVLASLASLFTMVAVLDEAGQSSLRQEIANAMGEENVSLVFPVMCFGVAFSASGDARAATIATVLALVGMKKIQLNTLRSEISSAKAAIHLLVSNVIMYTHMKK